MQLHSYVVHIKSDSDGHLDRISNGGVGGGRLGVRPFRGVPRVHSAHFRSALAFLSIALSHNPTSLTGLLLSFWSCVYYLFAFCSLFPDYIFMYLLSLLFPLYYVCLTTKKQCLVW